MIKIYFYQKCPPHILSLMKYLLIVNFMVIIKFFILEIYYYIDSLNKWDFMYGINNFTVHEIYYNIK